jgi:Putative auto-transporter adhesin, head GIN domain
MATTSSSASPARSSKGLVAGIALAALVLAVVALVVALDDDSSTTPAVQGSGAVASEVRELPPFDEVDLAGANTVTIGVGGAQRVVVRGEDDVLPLVTTVVEDGTLVIAQSESFDTASSLTVEVVVPALDAVRLSGAGTLTVDGHDLELLELSLPGSGIIRGSGDVQRLDVDLAGAGDVELAQLVATHVTVSLSGTGNVHVHANETLDAHMSGTGSVFYGGDPEVVNQEITGTGVIVEE